MAAAAAASASSSGAEAESGVTITMKRKGGRTITLKSNEDKLFEVTEASARQSKLIEGMINDGIADPYPLPNVDSETLKVVIEYCDEHGNSKCDTDEEKKARKVFDEGFSSKLDGDKALLINVIMAANYLSIEGLLNLTCDCVAETFKSGTLEEIRAAFNIPDDLTPEEKEKIRKEYAWAFE